MEIVGERIRYLRERLNYSQTKFAGIFNLGQSSVARYEKGEVSPSLELLVQIADYCNVSLDYILGRTDNPQGDLYDCDWLLVDPYSPTEEKPKQTLFQLFADLKSSDDEF